ncbi:uncharacterized protein LOC143420875 [Maylandia zebra]|uniref:uncharacterized protein LOC143420875 n=1 Tax=Maylandia zebra TaxID=106582 RepID=UPI00403D18BB
MIICVFCKKVLVTLRGYVLHCRVHKNEPCCIFKCVGANCSQTFTTYSAFKGHFYRVHNAPALQATPKALVADLKCAVSLCARHFQTVKELVSHLNDHIAGGRSVSCPVSGCKHMFTKKSSFTSHMCRKHKACSPDGIDDMYKESRPQPPNDSTEYSENTHETMASASSASDMPEKDSHSYLRNMCLFYLKQLLSYFEEKEESMLLCVEDTCLADEVQLEQVPLTPTIIMCGQSCYSSRRYMLSVDRHLVSTNISSFISALCLMFGSYYNFNIHYPSELASTLEFLQRCFFSINPEKGTKVENKNSKRRLSVNPRVLTLI